MDGQLTDKHRLQVAPGYEVPVLPAPRPGPQRRRVGQPRIAAAKFGSRLPGEPQPGEDGPRRAAIRISCQAPGPVPVVQVEAPQLGRAGLQPVRRITELPGHAEKLDPP